MQVIAFQSYFYYKIIKFNVLISYQLFFFYFVMLNLLCRLLIVNFVMNIPTAELFLLKRVLKFSRLLDYVVGLNFLI